MKTEDELKGYFADWYLSMPDFDETLLDKIDDNAEFTDETIILMYCMFKVGFGYGAIYAEE